MAFDAASARPEGFDAASARPYVAPEKVGALEAAAISAGHVLDKAATGLRSLVPESIRNAVDAAGNALGMGPNPTEEGLAQNEKIIAPVEQQHPVASFAGSVAPMLGMGPGGMATMAALEPGTPAERLLRGGATFGLAKGGEAALGAVGDYLAKRATSAPAVDPLLAKVQAAGLKVAPNEAGQQSVLQWVGGQVKTQQNIASKNVPQATALAAQEVGLPPGKITTEALQGVRDTAGKAYDAVASQGVLNATPEMMRGVIGLQNDYLKLTGSFKSLRNSDTEALLADLKQPQFDAAGVVEAIKRFRSDGFANIASADPGKKALGRVQLQAQSLLESMVDQNLAQRGMADAVSNLQNARQLIAKTYSIQNALDANGNVVASKFAQQLAKNKPLSGNLELLGRAAAAYPKSMQHFTATPPAYSALDFMTGVLTHGGKEALMLGARPLARAAIASGPYQAQFMTQRPSLIGSALSGAAPDMPRIGELAGLLGPSIARLGM